MYMPEMKIIINRIVVIPLKEGMSQFKVRPVQVEEHVLSLLHMCSSGKLTPIVKIVHGTVL